MNYQQFQLLAIFWQLGLIDSFNFLKICVNCGSQYSSIVATAAEGNFTHISSKNPVETCFWARNSLPVHSVS